MTQWIRYLGTAAGCMLLNQSAVAVGDRDEEHADAQLTGLPNLSSEQQRAAGIAVAHLVPAKTPARLEALGLVLDATTLGSDAGEMAAAGVAEHAASAEFVRLRGLYGAGAGASLKMLEAAQAEQAKAQAQFESAAARFALRWGPLAALPAAERQRLLEASASGRSLLLRADLPGRHSLGTVPRNAVLDVDGIEVPGRVLGALRQSTELQSVGLLIEVRNAPLGLAAGARVPVTLLAAPRSGLLAPREAVLYGENGAYVYKRLAKPSGDQQTRYVPVKVTLLFAYGDGWLIEGVDDTDDIVVQGASVLWSLQGLGVHAVDDDEG